MTSSEGTNDPTQARIINSSNNHWSPLSTLSILCTSTGHSYLINTLPLSSQIDQAAGAAICFFAWFTSTQVFVRFYSWLCMDIPKVSLVTVSFVNCLYKMVLPFNWNSGCLQWHWCMVHFPQWYDHSWFGIGLEFFFSISKNQMKGWYLYINHEIIIVLF